MEQAVPDVKTLPTARPSSLPAEAVKAAFDRYKEATKEARNRYIETVSEQIRTWFFDNYEDPAYHALVDGSEYLGCNETHEVIWDAFGDRVLPNDCLADEIIEATLEKIEIECGYYCYPVFKYDERYDGPEACIPDRDETYR